MDFREELETIINRHSQENGSNTPDFILADYLTCCLQAFDTALNAREKWYGRKVGWRAPLQPMASSFPAPSPEEVLAEMFHELPSEGDKP